MTTEVSTSTRMALTEQGQIAGFTDTRAAVAFDCLANQSMFWIGETAALGAPAPTYGANAFVLDAPGEPIVTITGSDEVRMELAVKPEAAEEWGVSIGVGSDAVIHVPQYQNVGRLLDESMPVGEDYDGPIAYNFLVVERAGVFLRLGGPLPRHSTRRFHLYRTPDGFIIRVMGPTNTPLKAALFVSLDAVQSDYTSAIAADYGVQPLSSRSEVPDWVSKIPAVLTLDMMRSDRSIAHTFDDVTRLIAELAAADAPEHLLLYLPGWNGPYDSGGPTYGPASELGGEAGLRSALEAAKKANFHLMVHTTGWGIDPYHPDIDSMLDWVVRNDDGSIKGWQIDRSWLPPSKSFGYRPARQSLSSLASAGRQTVTLTGVPDWCEVGLRIGGLGATAVRMIAICNGRTIRTDSDHFLHSGVCDHPFPLRLVAGDNIVAFEVESGSLSDSAEPWVEFHRAFRPSAPGSSWTWPILRANMFHPDYIKTFVGSVQSLVERFGIEAVHVDATWMGLPEGGPELLSTLRATLPGLVIGGEGLLHTTEMSIFNVIQNCKEDLIRGSGRYRPTAEQGALPVFGGRYEDLEWLGKKSPIASFAADYFRTYPHLCASHAFVPVGKVCNCYPPRQVHANLEELESVLRSVVNLNAAPGLRLNYHDYGLDDRSRAFILGL